VFVFFRQAGPVVDPLGTEGGVACEGKGGRMGRREGGRDVKSQKFQETKGGTKEGEEGGLNGGGEGNAPIIISYKTQPKLNQSTACV